MSVLFQPGERVRLRRSPASKGTVEAAAGRRVVAWMDTAGVRSAFQAADLEPDLPPAFEFTMMLVPGPAMPSYPGPYAVPGVAQPGFCWPAEPVTDWAAGLGWRFTEGYVLIYPQYLDTVAQETLVAVPDGVYYMNAVGDPGLALAPPGDNRWIQVTG